MPLKTACLFILLFLSISCSQSRIPSSFSDTVRLKNDLIALTKTDKSRNYLNTDVLNSVATYIHSEFSKVCDTTFFQTFQVDGKEYKNIIGSIGIDKKVRIIVGAHYDVCDNQEGADDNASGVAGILELARLLSIEKPDYRIDFVAYTLEEPPFFNTNNMGSYIHAKSIHEQNIPVKGMICLEMIGYFNDSENSQDYPIGILRWFYGSRGDFITVVQKFNNGKFGKNVKKLMTAQELIPTKSFFGPEALPGIDFSDHRNYWKFGYSAVMITNTAFYRNPNYHKTTDTIESLDLNKMSKVIDEVLICLLNL